MRQPCGSAIALGAAMILLLASAQAQPRPSEISFAQAEYEAEAGHPFSVLVERALYTSYAASAVLVAGPARDYPEVRVNVTFEPGQIQKDVPLPPADVDVPLRLVEPSNGTTIGSGKAVVRVHGSDGETPAPGGLALVAVAALVAAARRRGRPPAAVTAEPCAVARGAVRPAQ